MINKTDDIIVNIFGETLSEEDISQISSLSKNIAQMFGEWITNNGYLFDEEYQVWRNIYKDTEKAITPDELFAIWNQSK